MPEPKKGPQFSLWWLILVVPKIILDLHFGIMYSTWLKTPKPYDLTKEKYIWFDGFHDRERTKHPKHRMTL